jgi:hypothetical protein
MVLLGRLKNIADIINKNILYICDENNTLDDRYVTAITMALGLSRIVISEEAHGIPRVFIYGNVLSISKKCFADYTSEELTGLILYTYLVTRADCNIMYERVYVPTRELAMKYGIHNKDIITYIISALEYAAMMDIYYLYPLNTVIDTPVLDLVYSCNTEVADFYSGYLKARFKETNDLHYKIPKTRKDEEYNRTQNENMEKRAREMASKNAKQIYMMMKEDSLSEFMKKSHTLSGVSVDFDILFNEPNSKILYKRFISYVESRNQAMLPGSVNLSESTLNENITFGPKDESEFRYKLNKIIISSKYIDSEGDRTAILSNCFELKKKLEKFIEKETLKVNASKNEKDNKKQQSKMEYLNNMMAEIGQIEKEVVDMNIKPRKFGVFIEYPAGYDF